MLFCSCWGSYWGFCLYIIGWMNHFEEMTKSMLFMYTCNMGYPLLLSLLALVDFYITHFTPLFDLPLSFILKHPSLLPQSTCHPSIKLPSTIKIQPFKSPLPSWMGGTSWSGHNQQRYPWRARERWSMWWGLPNHQQRMIWNTKFGMQKILWWCRGCSTQCNQKSAKPICCYLLSETFEKWCQNPTPRWVFLLKYLSWNGILLTPSKGPQQLQSTTILSKGCCWNKIYIRT